MWKKSLPWSVCGGLLVLLLVGAVAAVAAAQSGSHSEGGAAERGSSYILSIVAQNATQTVNPTTQLKSGTYGFQVKNTGDTGLPECNLILTPWNFPPDKWSYNFIPSAPFEVIMPVRSLR